MKGAFGPVNCNCLWSERNSDYIYPTALFLFHGQHSTSDVLLVCGRKKEGGGEGGDVWEKEGVGWGGKGGDVWEGSEWVRVGCMGVCGRRKPGDGGG